MRIAKFLCAVLGAALLSSCSIGLTLRVTNGSAQMIAVSYWQDRKTAITALEPGEKTEFSAGKAFTILRDGKAHLYQTSAAEYEIKMHTFEGFGPFTKRLLRLVYAEDGCVYLMPPDHNPAIKLNDIQPRGFPVCPGNAK